MTILVSLNTESIGYGIIKNDFPKIHEGGLNTYVQIIHLNKSIAFKKDLEKI